MAFFRICRCIALRVGTAAALSLGLASCAPEPPDPAVESAVESAGEHAADPANPASDAGSAVFARVTDFSGRTVLLTERPTRVISLIPSVTEMIVSLGATDRLVARTDFDGNPLLDSLPSIGRGLTPNLEWVLTRRPDLMIGWQDGPSRDVLVRLRQLGVPVYSASIETLGDADRALRDLGRLLGEGAAADSLIAATDAGLDSVRTLVAGRPAPAVLYLLSTDPIHTVGPGTFLNEIIGIAGGRNVFHDAPSRWPQVSLEEVVRRGADVILVPGDGTTPAGTAGRIRSAAGWRELRAVREGRIHRVDGDLFHRPGPHVPEVARRLAEVLHPRVAKTAPQVDSAAAPRPARPARPAQSPARDRP